MLTPSLLAVEIDKDWLTAFGVLMSGLIAAVSYAFVRMYKALNAGRNANVTVDITADESKDKRRSRRDSVAWNRMNILFKAQDERERGQDKKIEELSAKAAKYEVEAAQCREREIEHAKRDVERDLEDVERDKRIRELENQLGMGSKEHTPLKDGGVV